MKNLAPILVFTYKRLDTLKLAIASLQENKLASESELFIFSDAAKFEKDKAQVSKIREYIKTITGFKNVHITEAPNNKGLAKSIIEGVSEVINQYDKVIVLEDDLVTSRNFLFYMNQGLDSYKDHPKIFSIAGFSTVKGLEASVFFTQRSSSWGWATWKDRWNQVDWEVKDYDVFLQDKSSRDKFYKVGSDLPGMLDEQMHGKINSWAIRWVYYQFRNGLYSVHPAQSKVINIGFSTPEATHTKEKFSRFKTKLDVSDHFDFIFPQEIKTDDSILKQFAKPYSFIERIKYKIINTLFGFIK